MISEVLGVLDFALRELKEAFGSEKERRRLFINVIKDMRRSRKYLCGCPGKMSPEGLISLLDIDNLSVADRIGLRYSKYFSGCIELRHIGDGGRILSGWAGRDADFAFGRIFESMYSLKKLAALSSEDKSSVRFDARLKNLAKRLNLVLAYYEECGLRL